MKYTQKLGPLRKRVETKEIKSWKSVPHRPHQVNHPRSSVDRGTGPVSLRPEAQQPAPPLDIHPRQSARALINRWLVCVLQQPKPGEPLYAQVNLEKKKKRQYELGVGQGQGQGPVVPGVGVAAGAPTAGQWVADGVVGVPDGSASTATVNVPPNSTAASAGDSWV